MQCSRVARLLTTSNKTERWVQFQWLGRRTTAGTMSYSQADSRHKIVGDRDQYQYLSKRGEIDTETGPDKSLQFTFLLLCSSREMPLRTLEMPRPTERYSTDAQLATKTRIRRFNEWKCSRSAGRKLRKIARVRYKNHQERGWRAPSGPTDTLHRTCRLPAPKQKPPASEPHVPIQTSHIALKNRRPLATKSSRLSSIAREPRFWSRGTHQWLIQSMSSSFLMFIL